MTLWPHGQGDAPVQATTSPCRNKAGVKLEVAPYAPCLLVPLRVHTLTTDDRQGAFMP